VRFAALLSGLFVLLVGSRLSAVECALPVVVRSAVRDIHESWWNGPVGYGFIEGMGGEKTGRVPLEVGRAPVHRFDADVHASNFQGPVEVRHPDQRPQWEWTADGEVEVSERTYPLLVARRCSATAVALPAVTVRVAEHDEWPLRNDGVGAFAVELADCASVLSDDRASGWTAVRRSGGLRYGGSRGAADIEFVEYVIWCYRCQGERDCGDGIVWAAEP